MQHSIQGDSWFSEGTNNNSRIFGNFTAHTAQVYINLMDVYNVQMTFRTYAMSTEHHVDIKCISSDEVWQSQSPKTLPKSVINGSVFITALADKTGNET